jgi:hypothetical protein
VWMLLCGLLGASTSGRYLKSRSQSGCYRGVEMKFSLPVLSRTGFNRFQNSDPESGWPDQSFSACTHMSEPHSYTSFQI